MTKTLLPSPILELCSFLALIVLHCSVRLTHLDYNQELALFCSYSWYQQYTHLRAIVHN